MANTVNTSKQDPAPFGALLLRLRAAAGLTQEQLASRASLSPKAIAALERGKRRAPRAVTVELLAAALELDAPARDQLVTAARASTRDARGAAPPEHAHAAPDATPDVRRQSWRLTVQPTPLVDRADDLALILRLLSVEGAHLLTLTGPAGVGKTRLALAAAARLDAVPDRFPDGVVWVDLTPVRDPDLVLGAIARGLGLLDMGGRSALERLAEVLGGRRLVVLDNFEQVLPAGAGLADLLAGCPGLALLVTSRVPLQIRWEQTLRIAPLPVPDLRAALPPLDALLAIPSVALFVDRARARRADFAVTDAQAPLVAQVAVQLDGLPLALELAAARLDVLSLSTLAGRLGDRLRLLALAAPDRPERQQSLEAAVGWSYNLLNEPEQRLFRCLGVFAGRVALNAIAAVSRAVEDDAVDGEAREAGDAGRTFPRLLSLAEKSLLLPVQPDEEGGEEEDPDPTFGVLETVRDYAREQLAAAGELDAARRAHAHYFLALAECADRELHGSDQRAWLFRLEREHDNLRAALQCLLEQRGPDGPAEQEAGLRLAAALGWFWLWRGYHAEGWRWLEEALSRVPAGQGADPAVRTRALLAAAPILAMQRGHVPAQAVLKEALALAQQQHDPVAIAQAATYLGLLAIVGGDLVTAQRVLAEARDSWEDLDQQFYLGFTLNLLGAVAFAEGNYIRSGELAEAALERLVAAGDWREAGITHINVAVVVWQGGDPLRAASHLRAGLSASDLLQDRFLLAQSVRAVLGLTAEHIDSGRQARLLGASDMLAQATDGTLHFYENMPTYPSVVALRARLEREGWDAAYREGHLLALTDIVALAVTLVDEAAQILAQSRSVPQRQRAAARSQGTQDELSQLPGVSTLTVREQEVLRLVAAGRSSKEIGRQLFLSSSTVNHHLTSVFNKLGVDTRAQAVAVASQRGLL